MIVKNEEKVIERCLESVLPMIDYWVISDTGSTDKTKELIVDFFKKHKVEGKLLENEWKNFEYNRNIVLEESKSKADYSLIIDADEILQYDIGFSKPTLEAECYMILTKFDNLTYYRKQLINNKLNWQWKGVLHEYLTVDNLENIKAITGVYNIPSNDGFRSANPNKFLDDATVLEKALIDEPDNTRYQFYLAQSYKDAKLYDKAVENYQKRAKMGGWEEEVYYSLYQVGICKQLQGENSIVDYIKAYVNRPSRLEPLYRIILQLEQEGKTELAYQYGILGIYYTIPKDVLFIEYAIYTHLFLELVARVAYKLEKYEESYIMLQKIMNQKMCDKTILQRVSQNMKFSEERIVVKEKPKLKIKGQHIFPKSKRITDDVEEKINLFVEFGKSDDVLEEYLALLNNVNNRHIDKIYVLNMTENIGRIDKVEYVNEFNKQEGLNLILESDCYLDSSISKMKKVRVGNNECVVLSAWKNGIIDKYAGIREVGYMFRDSLIGRDIGKLRNRMVQLTNPSLSIKVNKIGEYGEKGEFKDKIDVVYLV
jgi:hypothetical protein